jgi:tRNA threonylcarbamoyladenosine biosynthesis protein TsaE
VTAYLRDATPADAAVVHALTREVFQAYAALVPQPSSLRETVDDVAGELAATGGLVVTDGPDGPVVAVARFSEHDGGFWLRRVAVREAARRQGLAREIAERAEEVARARGYREVRVGVRTPLTAVADVWRRLGFADVAERAYWVELARPVPLRLTVPTPDDMVALGSRLAGLLRAGDLVLLSGDLGAGKTTLTRGLGTALGVRGAVTSPTFVIARVHPPGATADGATADGATAAGGLPLVHVDAYRLHDLAEVDDLDLDASVAESVTVVEWGVGKVEGLADSRLEVVLHRGSAGEDETRTVVVRGLGDRWTGVDLGPLAAGLEQPAAGAGPSTPQRSH